MNHFFNSHKNKISLVLLSLVVFSVVKCANETQRMALLPGVGFEEGADSTPLDPSSGPQVTTLTDIIDHSTGVQSSIAKQIFIKETLDRVLNDGLDIISLSIEELPWEITEEFFTELGASPHPAFSNANRVHVYSTKSVNGLRYLNAGFNVSSNEQGRRSIGESYLAFEVEKFNENFETTIEFLKETFLGEESEACLDTGQDQVFFKKDDWIVEVFKETEDTIDLNSVYPPRTKDDIGVVKVSVSKGGHYHHLEGTCIESHGHE